MPNLQMYSSWFADVLQVCACVNQGLCAARVAHPFKGTHTSLNLAHDILVEEMLLAPSMHLNLNPRYFLPGPLPQSC